MQVGYELKPQGIIPQNWTIKTCIDPIFNTGATIFKVNETLVFVVAHCFSGTLTYKTI
jgi:hypothetical protein